AESDVGAHLRQPDAAQQLAVGIPHRHTAVPETAPAGIAVARDPEVAVDVRAHTVRTTLDPIDHEVAEQLLVRHLVVGADVELVHVAVAARSLIARTSPGTDDIELLVVGREAEPVRVRQLVLGDDEIDAATRIHAIDGVWQLALEIGELGRLAEPMLDPSLR